MRIDEASTRTLPPGVNEAVVSVFPLFKPTEDRVLVEADQPEEKVGSIVMAPQAQDKPNIGTVKAVGPGKVQNSGFTIPVFLKPGQRVFFTPYTGSEIKLRGITYLVLRETDILGVVPEDRVAYGD